MQSQKTSDIKSLLLKDLANRSKFEQWVRANINIYNKKEIPINHFYSFIRHIEEQIEKPDFKHQRNVWFDALNKLEESISKDDKFKQRHSEDKE
jgi:hypothetical protein